jgi:hypothetical protein
MVLGQGNGRGLPHLFPTPNVSASRGPASLVRREILPEAYAGAHDERLEQRP